MKKIIFIFALLTIFISTLALAANTTTCAPGVITIVPDGTTDWYLSQDGATCNLSHKDKTHGLKITYIMFIPSAINDRLVLKNSVTGVAAMADFMDTGAAQDTGALMWRPPTGDQRIAPFLDASHTDLVLDTAASAKIIIGYK